MSWDSFHRSKRLLQNSLGLGCSAGKESTYNAGDLRSIPGLGRSPGEGKVYSLQYSGLENSMDYVHGVTKSRKRLSNFFFHFHMNIQPGEKLKAVVDCTHF